MIINTCDFIFTECEYLFREIIVAQVTHALHFRKYLLTLLSVSQLLVSTQYINVYKINEIPSLYSKTLFKQQILSCDIFFIQNIFFSIIHKTL